MFRRLRERNEWKFFGVLPKADRALAVVWWVVLVLRGALPAAFAVAMGALVGAVQRGDSLAGPVAFGGVIFVLLQVLTPIHQAVGANLGVNQSLTITALAERAMTFIPAKAAASASP